MLGLPPNAEAARLLDRMDAMPADRDETPAVRPDPHKHPGLWRHLERCHRDMISQMGSGLAGNGYRGFPAFPVDAGPVALHLYVWLCLPCEGRT
ncbi:acyltransferase domain-containing protein [Nonomuraea longispora]|uniref:acyltransferase domain-containing protein n=1 Tax=Nonomuraea longispora TaxID=1848320 RepID=UPI0026A49911